MNLAWNTAQGASDKVKFDHETCGKVEVGRHMQLLFDGESLCERATETVVLCLCLCLCLYLYLCLFLHS